MSKIIDYMNEMGLTNAENIKRYFTENTIDVIEVFCEYIKELAYEDWCIADFSPYSFAPSMEISGFGGCSEINCKISRAERFNRFASLYSDSIYLIIESITFPHFYNGDEERIEEYRYQLISDYTLIFIYSDLIVNNIAKIVPSHFSICPDCFAKEVVNESEILKLEPIIDNYCKKAKLLVTKYDDGESGYIQIKNLPEIFPDHDPYIFIDSYNGRDILKTMDTSRSIITNETIIKDVMKSVVVNSFLTSRFETFMSSMYQSKYITSKSFDKTTVDFSVKKTIGEIPAPVFDMPFFDKFDTKTILKLRESEHQSFNDYRIAMDQATKAYITEPSQINDIYSDIIYPAFNRLDALFDKTKRSNFAKNVGEGIIICSTVTLGVMTSVIPNNPMGIISALGGTGTLVKYIDGVIQRKLSTNDELEKQDFYFLWQLNRKNKNK